MFSVFIDPGYQPAPALPVIPQPKLNQPEPSYPLDREIVKFLRNQSEPVSAWTMANAVAASLGPPNRAARRDLTTQIVGRITRLIHTRYLRRVGRNYLTAC